jgi:hypothetical protein
MATAGFAPFLRRGQLGSNVKEATLSKEWTRTLKKKTAEVGVVAVQRRLGFVHT